jgi:hypothetical protein
MSTTIFIFAFILLHVITIVLLMRAYYLQIGLLFKLSNSDNLQNMRRALSIIIFCNIMYLGIIGPSFMYLTYIYYPVLPMMQILMVLAAGVLGVISAILWNFIYSKSKMSFLRLWSIPHLFNSIKNNTKDK